MDDFQAYLSERSLDATSVTLTGTVGRKLAYSKGDKEIGGVDYYENNFLRIVVSTSDSSEDLSHGPAFDDATTLLLTDENHPTMFVEAEFGAVVVHPEVVLTVNADKAHRRLKASETLSNATFDHAATDEQFLDACWQVFSLTDAFEQNPCTRETFDELSALREKTAPRVRFREFYADWLAEQAAAAPRM